MADSLSKGPSHLSKPNQKNYRLEGSGWSSELIHLILRLVLAPAQ